MDLKIEYIEVEKINPAPYNPRAITEEGFNGLRASIRRFGFAEPLVVNKINNTLVGGHRRLDAAKAEGLTRVPVVFIELSALEEKALNVTLNNPRIQGFFTDELQEILSQIKLDDLNGFMELKLNDLEFKDLWENGLDAIKDIDENLDGIKSTIKVTCPSDLKDEVLIYLKAKLLETSFEGVEVV